MIDPILSIIVPVYNVREYLPICLDSLTGQTLSGIEILCVDDGSQDGSPEVVLSRQEKDPRVRLLRQEHQGVSAARNLGLRQARGTYVAFVDSDDWVDPDLYQKMVAIAEQKCCDMVVCGTQVHPEHPENCDPDALTDLRACLAVTEMDWQASGAAEPMWKLVGTSGIWPFIWNKVIRRDRILDNGVFFSPGLKLGEDGVFLQVLFPYLHRVSFMEGPVYHYRYLRRDSAMVRLFQQEDERFGHHLDVMRVLLREYTDRGLLPAHGSWLMKWMIRFLYFGFISLPARSRKKYALQLREIFRQFSLDGYRRQLGPLKRSRIARMFSVHHHDAFRKLEILKTIAEDKFFPWY